MSRLLLSAKALRHLSYHTRAHTTPRFVRHASAARALDGTQSLIRERLNAVSSTLADITAYADWQSIEQEAEKLKSELQNEKAWEDKSQIAKALKTQSTLARLEKRISGYRELRIAVSDVRELADLADDELQEQLLPELDTLVASSQKTLIGLWLSEDVDINSAYVDVHAGSGGTEACDWAAMLARMYTRWAHSQNFEVQVVEESPGDVAGIKSTTLLVSGPFVYGYAQYESGVHRLVRNSPFDAKGARHTSFASVRVSPYFEDDAQNSDIEINPSDLEITTMRSNGAGGQHVNKTESAIRIVHIPSGIVVSCQQERSQHQNRRQAMSVLKSRLYELERSKRVRAKADAHDTLPDISWGSQIRNYVLHPYQLVKDVRTDFEVSGGGVSRVLDGELESFMEASLRKFRARK